MDVSISSGINSAWRLPLSSSELAAALGDMWREFTSQDLRGLVHAPGFSGRFPSSPEGERGPLPLLEFALVDEAEMARLNSEYLGCTGPTNILAFPAAEPALDPLLGPASGPGHNSSENGEPEEPTPAAPGIFPDNGHLGWLAVSPVTIRREAMLYRQDFLQHTLRLMAHGLAHLLGYEHGEEMDFAAGRASDAALARLRGLNKPAGRPACSAEPGSKADNQGCRPSGGSE